MFKRSLDDSGFVSERSEIQLHRCLAVRNYRDVFVREDKHLHSLELILRSLDNIEEKIISFVLNNAAISDELNIKLQNHLVQIDGDRRKFTNLKTEIKKEKNGRRQPVTHWEDVYENKAKQNHDTGFKREDCPKRKSYLAKKIGAS